MGDEKTPMTAALLFVLLFASGVVNTLMSAFLGGLGATVASIAALGIGVVLAMKFDFGGIGRAGVTIIGIGLALQGLGGFGVSLINPTMVLGIGTTLVVLQFLMKRK